MEGDDSKVTRLPVRFKAPAPPERTLVRPYEVGKRDACHHESFVVDETKAEVECATCGTKLNPMWVLQHLASEERSFHDTHKRYVEEMERLSERSSTKCRHCGKMTRISYAKVKR